MFHLYSSFLAGVPHLYRVYVTEVKNCPTFPYCHTLPLQTWQWTTRERHSISLQHSAHREPGGLRPDVSVVAADDGVLHHLGGHQLVVHVRLPRHLAAAAVARKVRPRDGE